MIKKVTTTKNCTVVVITTTGPVGQNFFVQITLLAKFKRQAPTIRGEISLTSDESRGMPDCPVGGHVCVNSFIAAQ